MKNLMLFLLWVLLIFSCQSDLEKVKGHWHMVYNNSDSERYYTLDINDSTVILNKFGANQIDTFDLWFNDKICFPSAHGPLCEFKIEKNKIFIYDEEAYIKVENDWNDKQMDFYSHLEVIINPTIENRSTPLHELSSKSFIHYGKPKTIWVERGKKNYYFLQVNDVFIEFKDLALFIEQRLAINSEKNFVLNLDKDLPQEKIDELVNFILTQDNTINLYRTYINEEKQCLGILPIKGEGNES